jgi:hypothetical protein
MFAKQYVDQAVAVASASGPLRAIMHHNRLMMEPSSSMLATLATPKVPQARGESSTQPFLCHNTARWAQAA